jgi:hypothetical protein
MFEFNKPLTLIAGAVLFAAAGFTAGYVVARDPRVLRRLARAAAGGLERISVAVAETREELSDLWADVKDDARHTAEDTAFEAAAAGAGSRAMAANDAPERAARASHRRPRAPRRTRRARTAASH